MAKLLAELERKMIEPRDHALMGDQRLGERQSRRMIRRRKERSAGLIAPAKRLVEAFEDRVGCIARMKPSLEGRARQIVELTDALETEPPQQACHVLGKPQAFDGKWRQGLSDVSMWDHDLRTLREAGKRIRSAQGLGQSKPDGEAEVRESPRHSGEEFAFAAEEMGNAGDVEPESVKAVDIDGRAVAARPLGEHHQAPGILVKLCWRGEEQRADGTRIGEAKTGIEALARGGGVDRREDKPALLAADEREGPVIRTEPASPLPLQPLDRPMRQPD